VLYLEHKPAPPLSSVIHALWYAQAPSVVHRRERVLPTGRVQIILNLARDFLLDCPESSPGVRMPPALVIGARTIYEIIDSTDLSDLIGIVFAPDGFSLFASDAVDLFTNRSTSLEDLWGSSARSLRDRLCEPATPATRLRRLEAFLFERFSRRLPPRRSAPHWPEVRFALELFHREPSITTVRAMARIAGRSERRFSQLFREEVGLAPKTWCRIQRFQRAVQQLHSGSDVPWAELALDCGFYDQSHFANEFRAFSGIDATTYSARRTLWANHVPVD
jgi:AraC-like DNA-binding protein